MAALAALPSPSLFGAAQPAHGFVPPRRTRRNTSSSLNTDAEEAFGYCDNGACYSDEEEEGKWLWRSPSASSSSSGQGFLPYPQQQSQQQSPTHAQPPLPRHNSDFASHRRGSTTTYDDLSESPSRQQLYRAPRSAPNVSRRTPGSTSRSPPEGAAVTPHEAVLRSRLEGVLSAARARSSERGSESCGEEWCYDQQPRRQRVSPLTPPPTPPFNARAAAAACKAMDGYVSFADVQGLGVPAGEDPEEEEGEKRGWRRWLVAPLSPRLRGVSVSESR